MIRSSRRDILKGAAATAALGLMMVPVSTLALTPEVEAAVQEILGGRLATDDGLTIETPAVAENGAQVPVTLRVLSPMTAEDHVTALHILATQNPTPGIGSFFLTPYLPRAEVFTRIRLAAEQDVIVLAELSGGRVLRAGARVVVSTGGCAT